jgi:hypothetical protein
MLQVYYIVDEDSDGVPDFNGTLLRGDTPNGVVVQGSDLLLSGFEVGKGMVWRLPNVHSYALRNQVWYCAISTCLLRRGWLWVVQQDGQLRESLCLGTQGSILQSTRS